MYDDVNAAWEDAAYEESRITLRLLRAAVHDHRVMQDLVGIGMRRDDFLAPALAIAWDVAVPVFTRAGRLDPTLMRAGLEAQLGVAEADDLFRLLLDAAPLDPGTDLSVTLGFVRRKVALHRMRLLGSEITKGARDADADPTVLAQIARGALERITTDAATKTGADAEELVRLAEASIDRGQATMPTIPLGIPDVDKALGGGAPIGRVTILMAPSGAGKSTYSRHILISMCRWQVKHGGTSVYVSFESDRHEIARELLQMISGVRFRQDMNTLTRAQWSAIGAAKNELASFPLIVEDGASLTAEELCSVVRGHNRRLKQPVKSLFVDYVQDLSMPPKMMGPDGHAHTSVTLRNFVARENIAGLFLSQVAADVANAEVGGKKAVRPFVESTAGSKKYAKDAAAILSAERNRDAADDDLKNISRIRLLKNRAFGTLASQYMRWSPETTGLTPCDEHGEAIAPTTDDDDDDMWSDNA